jgi:hypothetical protein
LKPRYPYKTHWFTEQSRMYKIEVAWMEDKQSIGIAVFRVLSGETFSVEEIKRDGVPEERVEGIEETRT